jgi:hypothetical protein
MPVLSIGGEKSLGKELRQQMKLVSTNVTVIVLPDTGHWILGRASQGNHRSAGQLSVAVLDTGRHPGKKIERTARPWGARP